MFVHTSFIFTVVLLMLMTSFARAQTAGDQIVDGIGETSLITRYLLNGDATDASRDSRSGKLTGDGTFVADSRWGKVLSLPGTAESGLLLPERTLLKVDAVSVTAWVRLRTDAVGQELFAFGRKDGRRLIGLLTGNGGVCIEARHGEKLSEQVTTGGRLRVDQWTFVCFVFEPVARTVSVFVNGEPLILAQPLGSGLEGLFDTSHGENNLLRIGGGLNGWLRDVRIYSIPLTFAQSSAIFTNASLGRGQTGATSQAQPEASPATNVDFGGPKLLSVRESAVSTPVGQLPKLPVFVDGVYENGAGGPLVRVIWPSPTTADAVQGEGRYVVVGRVPGTLLSATATVTVEAAQTPEQGPDRALQAFALSDVSLDQGLSGRDTPFIRNRDKFLRGLSLTNPDDFLYMFRDTFGQPQPPGVRPLGGWDAQTVRLRGHATGHYLSALAQAYSSTAFSPSLRQSFLSKMNYTVDVLAELAAKSGTTISDPTQVPPGTGREGYDSDLREGHVRTDCQNWGTGFVSAYPPDQFILLEKGATYGTRNDQIWAPYYTLHKILAGLVDCYEVGGNPKALGVARGMGVWCYERLRMLPAEQRAKMWNRYIAGEYGGMNEVLARVGRLTSDQRLLDAAQLFDNQDLFFGGPEGKSGLAANVDKLRGKHANQHIPQVIGALETYADTGKLAYFRVAENFWRIATTSYAYTIGGVAGARTPANAECFTAEPDSLGAYGFSESGQNETCATYNLLKLSRNLFMFRPDRTEYMDYVERALLNDILASVAEHDAGNTYHIPLNPGARKTFDNADMNGFTCCNGTALESHTKLQDTIYLKSFAANTEPSLYVNLFVPSTLTWSERQAIVKQETDFPNANNTRLLTKGLNGIRLRVRVPAWAMKGYHVTVNGRVMAVDAKPGTYADLGNQWKDGDVVEIRMPFSFRLERVMDQPNLASIFYGPVLLAAEEDTALPTWRPLALDLTQLSEQITGDPAALEFKCSGMTFRPFYQSYGRYSVYFDIRPPASKSP